MRPDFDKLLSKKNIANLLLLGILILAIPITVKLARERQILFSQAVNPSVVPTGANVETRNGVLVATDRDIEVQISDPGWSSTVVDAGLVKTAYAGHLNQFENQAANYGITRRGFDQNFCEGDKVNLSKEDSDSNHISVQNCADEGMVCSRDGNTLASTGCFIKDTVEELNYRGCNQYLNCKVYKAKDSAGNVVFPIYEACEIVPGTCGVPAQSAPPGGGTPPAPPAPPGGTTDKCKDPKTPNQELGCSCEKDEQCKSRDCCIGEACSPRWVCKVKGTPVSGDQGGGDCEHDSDCPSGYFCPGEDASRDLGIPRDKCAKESAGGTVGSGKEGDDCEHDSDCEEELFCPGEDTAKRLGIPRDKCAKESAGGTVDVGGSCQNDEDCKPPAGENRGYCCTGSGCATSVLKKCTLKDGTIPGGATPTPSPPTLRTVKFKIGEDPNTIDTQPDNTVIPAKPHFTLSPGFGQKTIVVKFFSSDPNVTKNEQVAITLVEKDPDMTGGVSCTTELSEEKSILFKAFGVRFATQSATSKLTAGTTDLQIDPGGWTQTAITARLKPAPNYQKGQLINVTLTRADSRTQQKSCTLDTSTLALGADLLCRSGGLTRLDDVDLVVIDKNNKANKIKETVSLDLKNGTITTDKIKSAAPGQQLKIWINAPLSVGRSADASASAGITVVPNISIPFGDIAGPSCPATGKGDNVINAFDAACLRQQWGRVTSTTKNCDCNGDGVCNAFEWSYMKQNIPLQGDVEP